jgi:hypothetical protein
MQKDRISALAVIPHFDTGNQIRPWRIKGEKIVPLFIPGR